MPASERPPRPDLIRCVGLHIGHGGAAILPEIDLTIRTGEMWAVIGRNGSGKTTFFRTLLGLIPPVRGRVERTRDHLRIAYVPQRSELDGLYPLRVRDLVRLGCERGGNFLVPRWREPARVGEAMKEVGIAELAERPFRSLSEGQKQRVLLARMLASEAELALLDEPTAAMDVIAERDAFELLNSVRRKHDMAVVVVSHYLGAARDIADRALLLDREAGTVVSGRPSEVLGHRAFRTSFSDGPPDEHCSHEPGAPPPKHE
jgi:zinc transport system ATP-binding protein